MEDFQLTLVPYQDGVVLHYFLGSLLINTTLYRWLINKLLYLIRICLDLAHVFGLVSRYMQTPKESHMVVVKAILRYLHHYPSTGLCFVKGEENFLGLIWCKFRTWPWWSNIHWFLYVYVRHYPNIMEIEEINHYSPF